MHRWIALWLLSWLLSLCTALTGQTRIYKFDEIPAIENLSNSTMTCLLQDSYGYMWIGSYGGLTRFDGYNTKTYQFDPKDSTSLVDNKISAIKEDSYGNLWIATQVGICYYIRDQDRFRQYPFNSNNKDHYYVNYVSQVYQYNDSIALFTNTYGILEYNYCSSRLEKFQVTCDSCDILPKLYRQIFDYDATTYVITDTGIYKLDVPSKKIIQNNPFYEISLKYKISKPLLESNSDLSNIGFLLDLNGFITRNELKNKWVLHKSDMGYNYRSILDKNNYWISTDSGIIKFNKIENSINNIKFYEQNKYTIKNGIVSDIKLDINQNLWVATQTGLSVFKKFGREKIKSYTDDYLKKIGAPYLLRSFYPVGNKSYITPNANKLYLFKPESDSFTPYLPELWNEVAKRLSYVVCCIIDKKNRLWLGGIEGLMQINLNDHTIKWFHSLENDTTTMVSDYVRDIYEDHEGKIWIASWDLGLSEFVEVSNSFHRFLEKRALRKIFEDSKGNLWAGSRGGVFKVSPDRKTISTFVHIPNDPTSISENTGFSFFEDNSGLIYIGTYGGGLNIYNPDSDNFSVVTVKDGLADNTVLAIFPDTQNNIWLATYNSWSKYNLNTREITNYDEKDGFINKELDAFAYGQDPDTKYILAGGRTGFDYFNPDDFQDDTIVPKLVFTGLQIFNRSVSIARNDRQLHNRDTFYLPQSLDFTTSITLPYHFNVITLTYAGLHFTNPTGIQYAHYLDGFQQDWQYVGTQRSATYTNLNPGQYTFHVKAANPDGVWNEEGRSLQITILPPWWRTWWAYTLYGIAILLLLTGIYLFQRRRWLLKAQLAAEKQEADRLKELDGIKTALYTNITHEFRTPLTVILGLTNIIREQFPQLDQQQIFEHLKTIDRNGNNLLQLVNQMLDLAKLEAGKLDLDPVRDDIGAFTKYLIESFHSLAEQKNIRLQCHIPATPLVVDFDPLRYQQIVQNLVSNAIKFTPDDGTISVQIYESNQHLLLSVADDGIGIAPESLPHLFDRFFQVESSATRRGEGTGIGLALTKELVQVMQGTITVESTPGEGTLFTVLLPITRLAQKRSVWTALPSFGPLNAEIESASGPQGKEVKRLPDLCHILIIEDNTDVRAYLRSCLPEQYYVQEAINGKAGVEKAIEQVPDLIISDVMMPEMDGFEVCTTLKNDERTSHIPVILLTAKADDASRMSGYRHGADAYLIKPFNREELLVRMEQMLTLRKKLQARYARIDPEIMIRKEEEFQQEDAFITKVRQTVLEHLEDPNYAIPQLCKSLLISRTQLHNKLVALTGRSTSHVIRTIRLQRGKELLQQTDQQVAEIAYSVGFSDPNYFSRCYHEEYGVTPSEDRT